MAAADSSDDEALNSSSSNELSDINTDEEEELEIPQDDDIEDEDNAEEEDEEEEDIEEDPDAEIIDDPDDAEDYDDNDENDEHDADIPSDTHDVESEDSDEIHVPKLALKRSNRPMRESKRRQLTFYEEDDMLEEEAPAPKKRQVKAKAPKRTTTLTALRSRKEPDDFEEFELYYKPNPQKLTERQRAKLEEDPNEKYEDSIYVRMDQQLLALNRKTAKRIETAEQAALRRAENARKRAHYKVKQLEEAKRDTLNKLLKRRATKTREKEAEVEEVEEQLALKPRRPVIGHPALLRWVSRPEGLVLAASDASYFEP